MELVQALRKSTPASAAHGTHPFGPMQPVEPAAPTARGSTHTLSWQSEYVLE